MYIEYNRIHFSRKTSSILCMRAWTLLWATYILPRDPLSEEKCPSLGADLKEQNGSFLILFTSVLDADLTDRHTGTYYLSGFWLWLYQNLHWCMCDSSRIFSILKNLFSNQWNDFKWQVFSWHFLRRTEEHSSRALSKVSVFQLTKCSSWKIFL